MRGRAPARHSLEAGLKYLIIGSLGSATLLYGLAMIYGATGATDFGAIADAIGESVGFDDPLLLIGIALAAPGSRSRPRSPPSTSGRRTSTRARPPRSRRSWRATKVAAFAVILRLFDHALAIEQTNGAQRCGARDGDDRDRQRRRAGQRSLKRLLAWSGVAQAGYILAGVVVGTQLGMKATLFYLAVYLL